MSDINSSIISLVNVTKSYGGIYALKNLSLDINKGEFIVLFGPNGAGKSTLLKILSTVIKPTEGEVNLSDKVLNSVADIRNYIGFISHETYLYENLTAHENLVFFARLYGLYNPNERADFLLERLQIENRAHDLVKNYSQGMKQRISFCRSIIHNPDFVILDEPFNSLDLSGINIITDLLKGLKSEGKTVLMSTHNYETAVDLADRFVVLVNGELVLDTVSRISKDNLREYYSKTLN